MAITYELDIYGSELQRGVNIRNDYARRRVKARGVGNTVSAINTVLDDFAITQGFYHQAATTLPLYSVKARRWGPDQMWIDAVYRRPIIGSVPTQPAFTIARFSSRLRYITWYNAATTFQYTFPAGGLRYRAGGSATDPNTPPVAYKWTQNLIDIAVPTVIPFMPNVFGLVGFVNSAPITFNGITFDTSTVLFRGATVTEIDTSTGILYQVYYNFSVARGGWVEALANFTGEGNFTPGRSFAPVAVAGQWGISYFDEFPQASFSGGTFPVHA